MAAWHDLLHVAIARWQRPPASPASHLQPPARPVLPAMHLRPELERQTAVQSALRSLRQFVAGDELSDREKTEVLVEMEHYVHAALHELC